MSRSVMLDMILKQQSYHRFENVELIQRREDENIVIQGEHVIYVLKEIEAFIWDLLDGKNSVQEIVDKLYAYICSNGDVYEYEDVKKEVIYFLSKLYFEEELLYEVKK